MQNNRTDAPPTRARPPTATADQRVAGIAGGVLAALIWGGYVVVTRHAVTGHLPADELTFLRVAVAGAIMLPFMFHWGWRRLAGVGWRHGLTLTLLGGAFFSLIFIAGMSFAPVSHGATIAPSVVMLTTLVLSWRWLGERPTGRRLAGSLVVFAGLLTMGWDGFAATAGPRAWIGDLMFVTAGLMWGTFTFLCRRWRIDPWRATAAVWSLSFLLYAVPYPLIVKPAFAAAWPELLLQAVYQGALGAVVATVAYTRAVAALGAARAALFPTLVPAIGVLVAIPVLGEWPSAVQAVGVGIVVAGMVLAIGR